MPRRSKGEGSVFYRKDRDCWVASRWVERYDEDSRQVLKERLVVTAKTKTAAMEKLRLLCQDAGPNDRFLFTKLLTDWLESKRHSVSPRTMECYVTIAEKYLRPVLGDDSVKEINRKMLDKLVRSVATSTGYRTAGLCVSVLKAVFKYAAVRSLIEKDPCLGLQSPKKPHQERRIPTRDEIRRILDSLYNDRYEAAFYLMAYLGLRVGEVRGLKWSDIQTQTRTLTIQRSIQRVPKDYGVDDEGRFRKMSSGLAELPPKTHRSKRSLVLPSQVIAALKRRHDIQLREKMAAGDHWTETGFIFTTQYGLPMDYQPLRERLNQAIRDLKLPKITIHSFRHAAATYLLAGGAQLAQVQQLLGHSQVSLTANLYGHVVPGASDSIVQELADALDTSQRSFDVGA